MLFQYIGPDAEAPKTCEFYGQFFVLNGEPVEVTNIYTIEKLIRNKSFKFEPCLIAPQHDEGDGLPENDCVAEKIVKKRGRKNK